MYAFFKQQDSRDLRQIFRALTRVCYTAAKAFPIGFNHVLALSMQAI
jgi:hypothetical protein